MDISNEASLYPFSIGPSSVLGRSVAVRILLFRSMYHFRQYVFHVLFNYMHMIGDTAGSILSWFHPRNPQGILALVTIVAFLLKRFTNVKLRAEIAYRRKFWRNMMRAAFTYKEWVYAARMLDKETPRLNDSDLYDVELVRNKLLELRHRRQAGSLRDIIFCMRADLVRNLGNMCNPELHKGRLVMPGLIKEYIDEVTAQLKMVCNSDTEELPLEEKLSFMHETRHAFGRTALLLSGGASLGAFHVGVVKTLVEHKLMPRIIAGSSVGSIICSIVATRSWPELQSFFEDSWHTLQFFDQLGGIFPVVKRVMRKGAVHEIRQLQKMLRHLTSNLTFQEAYDMTGRVLGITVCSPRKHEPPRLLNYLTSPHVVIWSAVTASCAFPGVFEAQELMAKNRSGEIVPYQPPFNLDPEEGSSTSSRRWRDGSLEIDLPMMQLKELFNVNHFIVSQANPHISPLLRIKEFVRAYGGEFAAKLAELTEMEVKHRCNQVLELGFPLKGLAQLFAQEWEGDVTVVMPATFAQYLKIIQNPSHVELEKAANQGRRCTWEKLSAIKANCGIELALDECVAILNHTRRLKRSADRAVAVSTLALSSTAKFSGSRRIPSWNCIARENSTGSLEGDQLKSVAPLLDQGAVGRPTSNGSSSGRNAWLHLGGLEGNDGEPEAAGLTSWTRSGGPLMRTASADKFAEYIRNLHVEVEWKPLHDDSESNSTQLGRGLFYLQSPGVTTPRRNPEGSKPDQSRSVSSIMVNEGDLLQAERSPVGLVFNLLKRETLNQQGQTQTCNSETAECFQLECPDKEMDGGSVSESDEDENSTAEVA
ncbi:hypothetical protein SAY87_017690 [Trapa incisa]|uniref:PNPLA domain-containing protein n=1 Tax=Trapa incisa TaxID=236973 RepID=A0AAN7L6Z5_9MYRT|nr:hypothetical protein SAY87_017690 [Trapa incisa]